MISFSRDQYKQNKGLDLNSKNKQRLRDKFQDSYNIQVAINIFLYLHRQHFVGFDPKSKGKNFKWYHDKVDYMIDRYLPDYNETLIQYKK